jgi:HD superfamily phosphodiesterase
LHRPKWDQEHRRDEKSIADEFLQRPAVREYDALHPRMELAQKVHDILGGEPLGKRREALDVREEHGHLLPPIPAE